VNTTQDSRFRNKPTSIETFAAARSGSAACEAAQRKNATGGSVSWFDLRCGACRFKLTDKLKPATYPLIAQSHSRYVGIYTFPNCILLKRVALKPADSLTQSANTLQSMISVGEPKSRKQLLRNSDCLIACEAEEPKACSAYDDQTLYGGRQPNAESQRKNRAMRSKS
jgi:hypothetical protein